MKMRIKELSVLAVSCLAFISCAKEKAYDEVHKVAELESRSSIKISKKEMNKDGTEVESAVRYLYVPMTLGTPKEVKAANPFYQGDEKIVRLKWAKDGLKVLQVELDERYADNDLNDVPVMTIPGDFKAFKCKEDSYGDCTNSEEENKDITWDQKKYFEPRFEEIEVEEVNSLDLYNVSADECTQLVKTSLVDYEMSEGVINVELEKTYKLNNSWRCIRSNYYAGKLDYNSFKVRFFYSLVELDQLATKGYEPVSYPVTDHSKFGFFKNSKEVLSDEFDRQRTETQTFLNRWAPERKDNKLTYYLSKSFNKPENKALLDATFKATKIMNKGFLRANMPFELEMIQQDDDAKEISPGDLRYNTIVLIDDPLANGLLGYGPSVSNPLTGEIVQAHTNMYGGVLTSTVRRVYDSAVDLSVKMLKTSKDNDNDSEVTVSISDELVKKVKTSLKAPAKRIVSENHNHSDHSYYDLASFDIPSYKKGELSKARDLKTEFKQLEESDFEGLDELQKMAKQAEAEKMGLHLDSEHAPEFFEVGGTVKNIPEEMLQIEGILNDNGSLKVWSKLTKSQRAKVKEIILVESYISTFVHELGHNLGLRHNFSGSFDKENFYTDSEAKSLGMKSAPAYSSVMDYAFSNFNELAAFGKYDIAALRFGYAREVENSDGKFVKIEKTYTKTAKTQKLKSYAFCTDENAGLNTTCNRFDEGTSLVEITKHKIQRYKDAYKYRNFRDGRNTFNSYGEVDYLVARFQELSSIRDILEDYESFVSFFGEGIMNAGCSDAQSNDPGTKDICAMIKDRIDSIKLIGDFFIEILKTPDHLCAVANLSEPNVIVDTKKMSELYEKAQRSSTKIFKSCFDEEIVKVLETEKLVPVAENGKFLNSIKSGDPKFKFASDRDVRGIWADKVIAMRLMFERLSSRSATDETNHALVDIPYIRQKLIPLLTHLVLGDELVEPIPFKTKENKDILIPYAIGSDYKINQLERYFNGFKSQFKMPKNGKADLVKTMLNQITVGGLSFGDETLDKAYSTMNFVTVKKIASHYNTQQNGDTQYYADGQFTYGAMKENVLASHMIDVINGHKILNSVPADVLAKVLKTRTNPDAPADLSDQLKAFFSLGSPVQAQIIGLKSNGSELPDSVFENAFGKELGALIALAYKEELVVLQGVASLKEHIVNVAPADATDAEKKLYKVSSATLSLQATGKLTSELVLFYTKQLKKLPVHKQYTNI